MTFTAPASAMVPTSSPGTPTARSSKPSPLKSAPTRPPAMDATCPSARELPDEITTRQLTMTRIALRFIFHPPSPPSTERAPGCCMAACPLVVQLTIQTEAAFDRSLDLVHPD